jgi:pyruvate dehydrogenase E1 component alpha subunit
MKDFSEEFPIFQILDENGNASEQMLPKISNADMLKMYELMVLARVFDETAYQLQREGRILTYAPLKGQEAAQIGTAFALQKDDWMFPSFRENGAYLVRGMAAEMLYEYWAGDERGAKIPKELQCFTVSIPVATQIPIAVGAAWAEKLRKTNNISLVYFGDGATSKGDFHEGINFAGVFKLPVIFVCQNNQWAISVPFYKQSGSKTVAQKAVAYGINGIRVDGNDIFAVYSAAVEAAENARKNIPTLIECFTYRLSDHTTADDASRYRSPEEVAMWEKKDPIARFEKFLTSKNILTEEIKKGIWDSAKMKINAAVKNAESITSENPEDIFDFTFAQLPKNLQKEKKEFEEIFAEKKEIES